MKTNLYGYKAGFVADPHEQPNENVMKPIPTAVIGIEGIKTRKCETVTKNSFGKSKNWENENV